MADKGVDCDSTAMTHKQLHRELMTMAGSLGISKYLGITNSQLKAFFNEVETRMLPNPYHNFCHIFDVSQFCFTLLHETRLDTLLPPRVLASFFLACVCHDLEHPGMSNTFQINSKSELAVRYNNESVLENHHVATMLSILESHGWMDKGLDIELMKECILATDMSKHKVIVDAFKDATADGKVPDPVDDSEFVAMLFKIVIKCCDVSNQARAYHVADKWNARVYKEFYAEGRADKAAGRKYSMPLHDEANNSIPKSTIGFINFVVRPPFDMLTNYFVDLGKKNPDVVATPLLRSMENMDGNVSVNTAVLEGGDAPPPPPDASASARCACAIL